MSKNPDGPPPGYGAPPPGYPGQQPPPQGQYPQPGYGQQPQPGYGPPPQQHPGGYAQPPQQQQTTVIVQSTNMAMSDQPMNMSCPHCQASIVTRCEYKVGMLTWLVVGGLLLFGCWLGCCLIPLCIDSLKDVEHHCPSCNRFIGCKRRM